jgi:short-subunit dehydrogenase
MYYSFKSGYCEALLVLTHHFARQFAAQRRGGIILMSSIVAFQGVPFAAHYAATKRMSKRLRSALQPN